jgi:hypothetical protein
MAVLVCGFCGALGRLEIKAPDDGKSPIKYGNEWK